jgi:hypothetical protein
VHRSEVEDIVALDIALRRNDREWVEQLPQDVERDVVHKLYYGHFFCHVFHQDYIVKKGVDPLAMEHRMWELLDARRAEYPAEHNVGHLYVANPALAGFYQSLDPTNTFNPIGHTRARHQLYLTMPASWQRYSSAEQPGYGPSIKPGQRTCRVLDGVLHQLTLTARITPPVVGPTAGQSSTASSPTRSFCGVSGGVAILGREPTGNSQLGRLHHQRHGQVLGRVVRLPLAGSGKGAQALLQVGHIQRHAVPLAQSKQSKPNTLCI